MYKGSSRGRRPHLSSQKIPLAKSRKTKKPSARSKNTNQVFSKIVKKYRPRRDAESLLTSKESQSVGKAKSRSKTTKDPESNLANKSPRDPKTTSGNFEYKFDPNEQKPKKVKSVQSRVADASKQNSKLNSRERKNPLNDTKSLNLEKDALCEADPGKTNSKSQTAKKKAEEPGSKLQEAADETQSSPFGGKTLGEREQYLKEEVVGLGIIKSIDLLNKSAILNNPAELISNLPNQSAQGVDVNVDSIVANTTANVLKMLKENPDMAKQILGIKGDSDERKKQAQRKPKTQRPKQFGFKHKKSAHNQKLKKITNSKKRESYLGRHSRQTANLSQRKASHGVTNKIKQNIDSRYNNTKARTVRKKNLVMMSRYKKTHTGKYTSRKSMRKTLNSSKIDVIKVGHEELIRMDSKQGAVGENLIEIFNSQLTEKNEQTQTLDPSKIRRLKRIVNNIENGGKHKGRLHESEFYTGDPLSRKKLTKTFDLGSTSGGNVYKQIDKLINPGQRKSGVSRKASPYCGKNFLKRNKEFIKKKNEEIQRKLKKKQFSKSQTISKSRKKEILKSPVPANAHGRGRKREVMRKKQRELVAANLKPKYKGGVYHPKGPTLPEKIKVTDKKKRQSFMRCKSNKQSKREKAPAGEQGPGHPSLKFILKPFSNRNFALKKSMTVTESVYELGELEGEKIEPQNWTIKKESKDEIEVKKKEPRPKKKKVETQREKRESVKTPEEEKSKLVITESKAKMKKQEDSGERETKRESKREEPETTEKDQTSLVESQVISIKSCTMSLNSSKIGSKKGDKSKLGKESKKMKNFSKENTVIKTDFKRRKSVTECQGDSDLKIEPIESIPMPKPIPRKLKQKKKQVKSKKSLIQNYMQDLEQQSSRKLEEFQVSVRSRKSAKVNKSLHSLANSKFFKTTDQELSELNRVISIDKQSSTRNSSTDAKTVQSVSELSNRDRIKLLLMSGDQVRLRERTKSQDTKEKKKKTAKKKKKTAKKKVKKSKKKPKTREEQVKTSQAKIKKKKAKQAKPQSQRNKSSNEIDLTDDRFNLGVQINPLFRGQEEPRLCLPGPAKLENSLISKKVNKWSKKTSARTVKKKQEAPIKATTESLMRSGKKSETTVDLKEPKAEIANRDKAVNQWAKPKEFNFENFPNPMITRIGEKENQDANTVEQVELNALVENASAFENNKMSANSVLTFQKKQPVEVLDTELLMNDSTLGLKLSPNELNFKKNNKSTRKVEIIEPENELRTSEFDEITKDFIEQNLSKNEVCENSEFISESQFDSHLDFGDKEFEKEKDKINTENIDINQINDKNLLENLKKNDTPA